MDSLPQFGKKKEQHYIVPDLGLNKHISFGPVKAVSDTPEKKLNPKFSQDVSFDEELIDTQPPKMVKKPTNSIANFLKHKLSHTPMEHGIGIEREKATLFSCKSITTPSFEKKSFLAAKAPPEEEKQMIDMGLDDMEDYDDMELDDLPEPTLK